MSKNTKGGLLGSILTGDMVKADVPKGKNQGVHVGRVAVRSKPSVKITSKRGKVDGISIKYLTLIQRNDGYEYKQTRIAV